MVRKLEWDLEWDLEWELGSGWDLEWGWPCIAHGRELCPSATSSPTPKSSD